MIVSSSKQIYPESSDEVEDSTADELLSFCPDLLLSILKSRQKDSSSNDFAAFEFQGAYMEVCLSGFARLSHEKSSNGLRGLDQLRDSISGYLGQVIKSIYEFKGDGKIVV